MSSYRFRWLLAIVTGIILLLFVVPVFAGILNIGNLTGIILFGMILLALCNFGRIHRFMQQRSGTVMVRVLSVLLSLILILIAAAVLLESFLMIRACTIKPEPGSTVVVLGCQNGSRMMSSRIHKAEDYLAEHPNARCILSGGSGRDEAVPEGRYMADRMIEDGIDPEVLFIEDASTSTRENLQFSLDVAEEHGLSTNFAIITNEFHQYRAGLSAKKLGIRSGAVPARSPWWLFPTFYVRELYGILYEVFL